MIIPRFYENIAYLIKKINPIIGFFGPHRVGKTTILKNYLKRCSLQYKLVNGKDQRIQAVFSSLDPEAIKSFVQEYELLVIEEVPYIQNFGTALKILLEYIPALNIIITGSSSLDLEGLSLNLPLFPISQMELSSIYNSEELQDKLPQWLLFGGYPEVIGAATKAKKVHLLEDIVRFYLFKDIIALERVKGSKILLDLLRLVATHVGKEVSFYELGCQLGIDYKTVERYLTILEKNYILVSLRGYNSHTRTEIHKKQKYYFYDNGILNSLIGNFNDLDQRDDVRTLWENFLFMERFKKCSYQELFLYRYFWKTWGKHEIDLVEEWGGQVHGYEFQWIAEKSKQEKQWRLAHPDASFMIINPLNYLPFCIQSDMDALANQARTLIEQPTLPSEGVVPNLPPNDPFFKYLWNLDDDGRVYGSGKGKIISKYGIQAMKAWKEGVSGKGVIVAILSSGVAYEDYYDPITDRHYKKAPDFEKTHFLSTLAKNFTIDPPGTHANDWLGTGTQECHIIAATINNRFGGCGIAYNAEILPITVMQRLPNHATSSAEIFINAIKYAADCGAKVIMTQVFLCREGSTHRHTLLPGEQAALHKAVRYAHHKGALIVCSSAYVGKYGVPKGTVIYPGCFSECLAVGCTRFDGTLTGYSNFGNYISIYAPSTDSNIDLNKDGIPDGIYIESFNPFPLEGGIYSFNQNFYYRFAGNPSNAIAEVAAVAALVFEKHPDWSPDQVKKAIIRSAKPFVTPGKDKFVQYGILDAYGAVTYKP